jgi:hypothetical protein
MYVDIVSKFDIRNTLPGLQHNFCDLWNEIARDLPSFQSSPIPYQFLIPFRNLYIALHQGTDAAPTAFDASTDDQAGDLYESSSFPLCNIPGHHPDSSTTPSQTTSSPPADLPVNVETSHTSLDLITQGPTDTPPIISPTSNSVSYPQLAPAVSISIPHPSFSLLSTSSNIPDPQSNADFRAVPDVPLSLLSGPVASDTPLPLASTLATSISLPPPLDTTEKSRESAMSVPDLATDPSRLQVSIDTAPSSDGIDRSE